MLGQMNEKKSLIYFASGMRLNGVDNQAQLHATVDAAIRPASRSGPWMRAAWWRALLSATQRKARRATRACIPEPRHMAATDNFQESQDTLYSLAADTGGKASFDNNDLTRGIVQAQDAISDYYILGYYTTNTGRMATSGGSRFRSSGAGCQAGLPAGLLREQGIQPLQRSRQGAAA